VSPRGSQRTSALFQLTHKWEDGLAPSNVFQLQEMGETGEGSLEPGDASGEIFWMKYPTQFLKHFFETFPDLMPKSKDVVDAVGNHNDHKSTGPQETVLKADDRVEGFPNLCLGTSEVYRYYALKTDTTIDSGPRSGQFKAEFQ
jgi:hypothetical protein